MNREAPWVLRLFRLALVIAAATLVLSIGFAPSFQSEEESSVVAGRNAATENLRLATSDRAIARLGQLRENERGLRALEAAHRSSSRLAEQTLVRSAAGLQAAQRAKATPVAPAPTPAARFIAPVEQLTAEAKRRDNVFDVELRWGGTESEPNLRFEIWRWSAAAEPRLIVANCAELRYLDAALPPGPIQLGYTVFAVTADDTGSRSESRAVQVELAAIHALRLVEAELVERNEPPVVATGASEPPSEAPESVRIEVTRIDDGRSELVEVRPGEPIGQVCVTGIELVALHWTEQSRPIRYREPIFRSDGTLVPGENGAQTKTFVLEAQVWLPAAEVRDGWGRSLQILPPSELSRGR